jgi:hypothetical protein
MVLVDMVKTADQVVGVDLSLSGNILEKIYFLLNYPVPSKRKKLIFIY